ncbi:MAG: bifunctional pyr operon transcriptional regulator/uracil phosphoribosyltransferase PyrR [Chitinophagaceae bacterium]|nr:bifunctional pyr operon transcriptional regulator/uracil phosphoribosyltransferase PyrR [Chitinophagaceae bacterium]
MKILLNHTELCQIVEKLAGDICTAHTPIEEIVFLGIQQGGVLFGNQLIEVITKKYPDKKILYGHLDITFYRDDIRKEILAPDKMNLPFNIDKKKIILLDDVLFTGRTIKAALDALLDYGRPEKVELCVLIDRHEYRQFPIQPDYIGKQIKTERTDKVKLINGEVVLKNE